MIYLGWGYKETWILNKSNTDFKVKGEICLNIFYTEAGILIVYMYIYSILSNYELLYDILTRVLRVSIE